MYGAGLGAVALVHIDDPRLFFSNHKPLRFCRTTAELCPDPRLYRDQRQRSMSCMDGEKSDRVDRRSALRPRPLMDGSAHAGICVTLHDNMGENYRDNLGESYSSVRICGGLGRNPHLWARPGYAAMAPGGSNRVRFRLWSEGPTL